MMKTNPASGRASAHRYNLASLTTIFKTRIEPCPIAVRADIKKSEPLKKKPRGFAAIRSLRIMDPNRIQSSVAASLRFTDHWRLKTDDSQRRCKLLFP